MRPSCAVTVFPLLQISKITLEFLAADAKCNAVSPATLHIVTSEQCSKICLSITIEGPAHARSNKVLPALSTTCGSALWRHNISIAISLPMAIAAASGLWPSSFTKFICGFRANNFIVVTFLDLTAICKGALPNCSLFPRSFLGQVDLIEFGQLGFYLVDWLVRELAVLHYLIVFLMFAGIG
jgi:hypothetical protein